MREIAKLWIMLHLAALGGDMSTVETSLNDYSYFMEVEADEYFTEEKQEEMKDATKNYIGNHSELLNKEDAAIKPPVETEAEIPEVEEVTVIGPYDCVDYTIEWQFWRATNYHETDFNIGDKVVYPDTTEYKCGSYVDDIHVVNGDTIVVLRSGDQIMSTYNTRTFLMSTTKVNKDGTIIEEVFTPRYLYNQNKEYMDFMAEHFATVY